MNCPIHTCRLLMLWFFFLLIHEDSLYHKEIGFVCHIKKFSQRAASVWTWWCLTVTDIFLNLYEVKSINLHFYSFWVCVLIRNTLIATDYKMNSFILYYSFNFLFIFKSFIYVEFILVLSMKWGLYSFSDE